MTTNAYFVCSFEQDIFTDRYKNPGDVSEMTWEGVYERVAHAVAFSTDGPLAYKRHLAGEFFDMMSSAICMPSSPQLWNYGADRRFPRNGSSCFTGRMGDTLEDFRIADGDSETVYVASGGMGLLLDPVRSRGCFIRHCSEGAMGSMCFGGPLRRVEATTGYITGSGRARGAAMFQLGLHHPDSLEFITAKTPTSLGWLDDWRANAWAQLGWTYAGESKIQQNVHFLIERFCSHWVFFKDWPIVEEVCRDLEKNGYDGNSAIDYLMVRDVIKVSKGVVTPMVTDWNDRGIAREANRDWNLPLQNCNMSVRVSDEFMHAVDNDDDWVFHFFDNEQPKRGEHARTKTDCINGELKEYAEGQWFEVSDDGTKAEVFDGYGDDDLPPPYRYAVVITTWEGLRQNLAPNKNQWRDTEYARLFRTVLQPAIGSKTGTITARQIWRLINEGAWNHADPGVVFSSTYERFCPVDTEFYGERLSNPCSEYLNPPGGSCDLISTNLRLCADNVNTRATWGVATTSDHFDEIAKSDMYALFMTEVRSAAKKAHQYISHSLEYSEAPVPYINEMTHDHFRTVGVGIMGLAEALFKFHITYGSRCAQRFSAAIMSEVALTSWENSFELAMEDGWKKPKAWNPERMESIFSDRHDYAIEYGLPDSHVDRWLILTHRVIEGDYATHTCVTSVAPTGTISKIVGWQMTRAVSNGVTCHVSVSGGGEPVFAWNTQITNSAGELIISHDMWTDPEHYQEPWMKTSEEISAEGHIRMQAALCSFCCMSVSKTVNMPETATVEDVMQAYELAWKLGIPGTSVYRNKSKPMQVMTALECPSGECGTETPVDVTFEESRAK